LTEPCTGEIVTGGEGRWPSPPERQSSSREALGDPPGPRAVGRAAGPAHAAAGQAGGGRPRLPGDAGPAAKGCATARTHVIGARRPVREARAVAATSRTLRTASGWPRRGPR
jgi:hypothetical protein